MASMPGNESDGLVAVAFVYVRPVARSLASVESEFAATNASRSKPWRPSMLISSTRAIPGAAPSAAVREMPQREQITLLALRAHRNIFFKLYSRLG